MMQALFAVFHSGFNLQCHPGPSEPFEQQGGSPVLALMTCISMTTVNSFSPVGLRDYKDDGGFSLTLQLAFQVKFTIKQNQRLLPTDESQSFRGGCQVPEMVFWGFLLP